MDHFIIRLSEGLPGVGVPVGGTTGQVLKKTSGVNYATEWSDESGGGSVTEYSQSINNNQSTWQDITDLLFNKAVARAAQIFYTVHRKTSLGEVVEAGSILIASTDSGWLLTQGPTVGMAGMQFDMSDATTGQIQYKSSNMTGTPVEHKLIFTKQILGV